MLASFLKNGDHKGLWSELTTAFELDQATFKDKNWRAVPRGRQGTS